MNIKQLLIQHHINEKIYNLIEKCEKKVNPIFDVHEEIAQVNQLKVIDAFRSNMVSARHFNPSTGYGYGDEGRNILSKVFSNIFKTESAIVSPHIMSGTHAISLSLYALLRSGDTILSLTGMPYDTLKNSLVGSGSLEEYGITFKSIPLINGGKIDIKSALALANNQTKIFYIQRSTGYEIRNAITCDQIKEISELITKYYPNAYIFVDNCYGEFVESIEPPECGAHVIAGSLIKNPGGGLAPTGGYIVGSKDALNKIAARFTTPGILTEIGSYATGYQYIFQGLFLAPHTVLQALKCVILASAVFNQLGFSTIPTYDAKRGDITQSIIFGSKKLLTTFIRNIQSYSPIDSFVIPYAWDMPGYNDPIIMAAGTFVQGASIELTADAPIKEPYCAYLQGALTYEHAKIAIMFSLNEMLNEGLINI